MLNDFKQTVYFCWYQILIFKPSCSFIIQHCCVVSHSSLLPLVAQRKRKGIIVTRRRYDGWTKDETTSKVCGMVRHTVICLIQKTLSTWARRIKLSTWARR